MVCQEHEHMSLKTDFKRTFLIVIFKIFGELFLLNELYKLQ